MKHRGHKGHKEGTKAALPAPATAPETDGADRGQEPPEATTGEEPRGNAGRKVRIVGIGASAGGLEALGELLPHLPVGSMAFVVVQHLAPHYESMLPQLLSRNNNLDVVAAAHGMPLEANHLYVIPPNTELAVLHGVIQLLVPAGVHGPRLPIDYLFRSLADDQGRLAIGIVLSGTGTDGTLGLKAIKEAGGVTFVQDPSTAKYDGMPRSAYASGSTDFCLPPKEIGEQLARMVAQPGVEGVPGAPAPAPHYQDQLGKLIVLIRAAVGTDLSHYKLATVERRIEGRMSLHNIGRLEDYVRYVQENRDEVKALYNDMLITVTSFFRDPVAYQALKDNFLPQILARKQSNESVRVWVLACATGEEAYSIAMCLLELLEENSRSIGIQIFGTDLDDDSISHARRGVYPATIVAHVSPERLSRFFTQSDGKYQISRRVRDLVVFSRQNVLKDAPFSRMDLVSCRNLLIYLQPTAQKKVLRILHYALNSSGTLLLGSSETVGDAHDLFSLVDRKHKIYSKKNVAVQPGLDVTFDVTTPRAAPRAEPSARPTLTLQGLADRKVLDLFGPPGVVINEELEILQFRGHTGPYLDPTPGAASFNLLRVARFAFHIELKKLVQQALTEQMRATTELTYQDNGVLVAVQLDVIPLLDPKAKTRCLLVLFQKLAPPKELPVVAGAAAPAETPEALLSLAQRSQELEHELAVAKEYLQTTIEERETTYEELKSANEELQSTNEELQSTNEELQTSKEEMQSTNEELTTVNDELQSRMAELSQANDDLHNVLSGVDNPVIIVGMDLRIRRYTGAAEKLFHLVPGDTGRTVGFLEPFLGAGALEPKVHAVIGSLATSEEEVLASNQRWYSVKISPYKTLDHSIRGALVSVIDIDIRKRAAEMTRDVGAYATKFLAAISHPLLILDRNLRVVWSNDAFLTTFQLTAEETVGALLPSLGGKQWTDPGLRERLDRVFNSGSVFRDYQMRLPARDAGMRELRVGGSQIPASGQMSLVLLSLEPSVGILPEDKR